MFGSNWFEGIVPELSLIFCATGRDCGLVLDPVTAPIKSLSNDLPIC